MKFSINSNEFQVALTTVSKGTDSNPAQPILAGILLKAEKDTLVLESTNLTLSIHCSLPAMIEEEGETVIPSKLLVDVIKSLPDAAVHVEAEADHAVILCETSTFSLKTLSPEDFPGFPVINPETTIKVPFTTFRSMVRRVAKVTSRDESRAILTGILIQSEENKLRMVATDSYRLAVTETPFDNPLGDFTAVVASSFMQDLASLPEREETIELSLAANQIVAHYSGVTFINRRIEGNYPPYKQLIPNSCTTRATYNTKQLIEAVKRTSLLSNKTAPLKLDLNNASQTTQVSTQTQDVGAASETLRSEITGDDVEIAFNFGYMIDGLASVETENVFLELQGPQRPGIFKADADEAYLYLIMPIRLG